MDFGESASADWPRSNTRPSWPHRSARPHDRTRPVGQVIWSRQAWGHQGRYRLRANAADGARWPIPTKAKRKQFVAARFAHLQTSRSAPSRGRKWPR